VADPNGIAVCTNRFSQDDPAVASDGTNYFVIWSDQRNSPYPTNASDIYGTRVTASGSVLDPAGIPICTAASVQDAAVVAFNGNEFVAVWQDSRNTPSYYEYPYYTDIFGTRISINGLVQNPGGIPISTANREQTRPSVAANGSDF